MIHIENNCSNLDSKQKVNEHIENGWEKELNSYAYADCETGNDAIIEATDGEIGVPFLIMVKKYCCKSHEKQLDSIPKKGPLFSR
jgi:hypothetical protein